MHNNRFLHFRLTVRRVWSDMWVFKLIGSDYHVGALRRFIRNHIHACSDISLIAEHVTFEIICDVLGEIHSVESRGSLLFVLKWASLYSGGQGSQLLCLLNFIDWQNISQNYLKQFIEKELSLARYHGIR